MLRKAALAAALLGVLVHANALGNGFAYDDVAVIQTNQAVHDVSALGENLLRPYWPGTYAEEVGVWRPVVTALFTLEWAAFGGDPRLFHLVGVLLHGVATGLVVMVLGYLLPLGAALAGGLVFAVHPVHVEAVANLVGNAEVLATVFVLLALWVHLGGGERYGPGRAVAVGGLFALGVLTKEGAAVVPGLVFLVDMARRDVGVTGLPSYLRRRAATWVVLTVTLVGVFLARLVVLGSLTGDQAVPGGSMLDVVPRIHTVASVWPHYVRLLLLPTDLAADYGGIVPVTVGWGPWNTLGVALVLGLLALSWWTWRQAPPMDPGRLTPRAVGVAVLWFGIAVTPVANVVFLAPVLLAERNLYLPSVAAAVGLGWLLAALYEERKKVAVAATALLVVAGGLRTWTRTPVWKDTDSVFAALLEGHPESGRAWLHYGDRLLAEGQPAPARKAFSVGLALLDSEYTPATQVGSRLLGMDEGSRRAGEFLLLRAWRERPEYYTAPGWLAVLYLTEGRHRDGEAVARAALRLAPGRADMHRVLAGHLSGQGRYEDAVAARKRALALRSDPPWSWWVWLARDLAHLGRSQEVRAALDSARSLAPGAARPDIDRLEAELLDTPRDRTRGP